MTRRVIDLVLTFPGSKCAREFLQHSPSWGLGAGRRRPQLLSSHFPRWNIAENLRDLSGRAIFRERFPIIHPLVPIGILTGCGWELAAAHLVSESGFLELPDDNAIRSAHLYDHCLNLIVPIPRNRNSGAFSPAYDFKKVDR